MLNQVSDNVWAAGLFLLAAILAGIAHFGHDKDLLGFAGTVAMTGAALFHASSKSDKSGS